MKDIGIELVFVSEVIEAIGVYLKSKNASIECRDFHTHQVLNDLKITIDNINDVCFAVELKNKVDLIIYFTIKEKMFCKIYSEYSLADGSRKNSPEDFFEIDGIYNLIHNGRAIDEMEFCQTNDINKKIAMILNMYVFKD